MSQLSLLPQEDTPERDHDQRTPWTFHRDQPIQIQQSVDRCPDCQAPLNIRERIGTMPWCLIMRVSRESHAQDCVARNPTQANVEKAIAEAYARNEPLATIQALDRRRQPRRQR